MSRGPVSDRNDPLEQFLDLAVYAPIGLALLVREQIPTLVGKGRETVTGRVRVARFIGQFAVAKGRQEIERRLAEARTPAPPSAPASAPPSATAPEPPSATAPEPSPASPVVIVTDDAAPRPLRPRSADEGALPIEGYDALAASQVVGRLAGLDADGLEQVRRHESAHRARRTVLARIAQLQAAGD